MTGEVLPYGRQTIDEEDVAAVVRALRSDYLTTGPEVASFEAELATACGARHAVAVANGTAALHCAYAAAGIGPGDEVVTTPLTFSATANMVLAVGGRPVFADVAPDTLCLDPAQAAAAVTPQTKAIAVVDFAGHPAAMDEFRALARERGCFLVEDAAHSFGGSLHGRRVGALADMTTFSFHPVKTITTGEGGAIVTDDDHLAQRMRDFRNHGIVRESERLRHGEGPCYYEVQSLGMNYRLTDIQCALGRSQLRKLPRFAARRSEIVRRYREALSSDVRIRLVVDGPGTEPVWHLFTIQLSSEAARAPFIAALQRRAIRPQVHYICVNDLPLYRDLGYRAADTPVAYSASRRLVSLPLFPGMADVDVERVVAAVREALDEIG